MNHDFKFFFVTGCPGSAWSMISQQLKSIGDKFDRSDETLDRSYNLPKEHLKRFVVQNENWRAKTHLGCYFGPFHEYGKNFDNLERYSSVNNFYSECLKPFNTSSPYKMIKSHWFSYNLDWLWDNCKGHKIMMIWRDPDEAEDWWYKMGGWNIHYPCYTWYENPEKMHKQIIEENELILDFAKRKNIEWIDYDHENRWISKLYKKNIDFKISAYPIWKDFPKIAVVDII